MMLCYGGVNFLKSPAGKTGGKRVIEKFLIELEARLSHFRQGSRNQVFERKPDSIRTKRVDAKFSPFKSNLSRLEDDIKLRVPDTSNVISCKNRQDEVSKTSKKTIISDASCKQDAFGHPGLERFSKIPPSDAGDHSGEDWRSLSRALASHAKVSAISNHELMRIAELRFSSEMNEGDCGNQVVLLQKALFWLGHLSKQSDITGYFGIETKQALCEFQDAHGVRQTGLWGGLSKQALWHTVSAEIMHRAVDEKSGRKAKGNLEAESDIFKQIFLSYSPMKFADVLITPPKCNGRFLSGIAFLVVGVLLGWLISRVSFLPLHNNIVKRKIVRSMEIEKGNPISRDKNLDDTPNISGATIMKSTSEQTSSNPSHAVDASASGQVDDSGGHARKVFSGPSYTSSLGPRVQNGAPKSQGLSKRHAFSLPNSMQRVSSSKLGADSGKVKQPGQLIRPISRSGFVSRIRDEDHSSSPSFDAQGTSRPPHAGGKSRVSRSTVKHTVLGQMDEIPGASKRFENDYQVAKDDGAAVGIQDEEEPNVRKRIEELRQAVETAEQNGQAAVLALQEERKRSRDLEDKISRQRESAAALEKEVRVLKESHDSLLESLRKKTGPATRGASLLYRDFKNDGRSG